MSAGGPGPTSGAPAPGARRGPGSGLAAFSLAVLLAAALAWPLRGYVTDDTFIHLQYARHLAAGDGLVFNPGERVYGTTSPLWVLLVADAMALGVDGLLASKLVGALATLAALALWTVLVHRTLADRRLAALATIAWAAHAWMLRWSLSGMETPLATALVLAGLVAFTSHEPSGSRSRLASLLWALAGLARPECGLLLPLWVALRVLERGARDGVRGALAGLWPGLLLQAGWFVFAFAYFGTPWPNTLAAKAAGGVGLAYHLEQLARQGAIVAATDGVALLLLAAALADGVRRARWRRAPGATPSGTRRLEHLLPGAWLVAIPILYALRGVPVLSRYLVPLLPVLAWLAWRWLDRKLAPRTAGEGSAPRAVAGAAMPGARAAANRFSWVAPAVALLMVAQNLVTWQRVVRPQVQTFTTGMHATLIPWGMWFASHTSPEAVIAAPDIGALGYYSHRRVVDLAGLVTPEMVPVLREMPQEDAIARFAFAQFTRPEYLVDRAPQAWDLLQRSPWRALLEPLGQATIPNLGVARPDAAVYSFYRVRWAAFDSLDASH